MLTVRQSEIIQSIKDYYKQHNVTPKRSDIISENSSKRAFGSWSNALEMAQVPLNTNYQEQRFGKSTKCCSICNIDITNTRFKKYCKNCGKASRNQNSMQAQRERGLARKLSAIQYKGGKCELCGYRKNVAALTFHHTKDKKFGLDIRSFSNRSSDILQKEIEKCQLLCQNCHSEIHNPDLNDIF